MYNVKRNDYINNPKNSTVYTPQSVVQQLYAIIQESSLDVKVILDPAVGSGNLLDLFDNIYKIGVDIDDVGKSRVNEFIHKPFQSTTNSDYSQKPDLVVCNPPFNGCRGRKLYAEVFLKHIVELFGNVPVAMITPMGLRLNQKISSKRWQWLRDNAEITGILSLPLNIFDGVKFHSEVVFFNLPNIRPHYFLDAKYLNQTDINENIRQAA